MGNFLKARAVYIFYTLCYGSLGKYFGFILVLSIIRQNGDMFNIIYTIFVCGLFLLNSKKKLLIIFILAIIIFSVLSKNLISISDENKQNFRFIDGEISYHVKKVNDQDYMVLRDLLSEKLLLLKIKNENNKFELGQIIHCDGEAKLSNNNREYNYNVNYEVDYCNDFYFKSSNKNYYITLINSIRNFIDIKLDRGFLTRDRAYIKGILIGDTDELPEYVNKNFTTIGISHIVAVSGFNMNVVYTFLNIFLIKVRKNIRYIFIVIILTLYISVIGINNIPAIRAYIMITISILLKMFGKYTQQSSILFLTIIIILLIFPRALTSISFQLSFMATVGMMQSGRFEIKNKFEIKETAFAIFFTLPIIIYFFGSTNLLSLFANILILPFVGPLTYMSITYLILPFDISIVGIIIAKIIDIQMYLVNYFIGITNFIIIVDKGNLLVLSILLLIIISVIIEINYRSHLE